MLIRPIREDEKILYNRVVHHPLQSWEWGEFRKKTGLEVERIGFFQAGKLQKALQVTFHPLPIIGKTVGYFPKGDMPDEEQISALTQLAQKHNALFIKMEPNVAQKVDVPSAHKQIADFLESQGAQLGRPLFTKYTFQLDLTPSEDDLFSQLKSKTRYNVNLAFKKGVTILEDSTKAGLEKYLEIQAETTRRQGFYAHSDEYFRQMWEIFNPTGMMKIFHAVYQQQVLTSWILFIFDDTLYYPYGASSSQHRDVMASNLMMWEIMRLGKKMNCTLFDMWGSLGPNPDPKDPWYGFHRFKSGYGGELVEFLGTYDLVQDLTLYKLFRLAENTRWKFLRLKAKLKI